MISFATQKAVQFSTGPNTLFNSATTEAAWASVKNSCLV